MGSAPSSSQGRKTYVHSDCLTSDREMLTSIPKTVSRAVAVDMRVGAIIDGAVVYYDNGEKVPCGPRVTRDQVPIQFGKE